MQIKSIPLHKMSWFVLTSVLLLSSCGDAKQKAPGGGKPGTPEVTVLKAKSESVPVTAELSGRTVPYLVAELRPQVTGIIKQRLFDEGSDVKAGQMLYQIDPASYQAAHDSARATLERAESNLALAHLKANRYTELLKMQAISAQANDEAQAAQRQCQAEIGVARAALDKARIELNFTRLTAPINGRIGRSTVTAGALVTANQTAALATVQQLDPIYVDLTQSSAELLRLRRDLAEGKLQRNTSAVPVQLVLEDGSVYSRTGKLAFSEVTVDPSTGSVTLRAVFPNPKGELLPGMYVRAQLVQGINRAVVLIPHAAMSRDPRGNAQVMLVNSENKVEPRIVKTAQSIGDKWVVTEGLAQGERVIIEGLQRARPGTAVLPQEAGTQKPAAIQ